jgi:amino acid adenylation domain-containing protein
MAVNPLPPGVRKPGSVGRAAGCEVAIMDEQGSFPPAGHIGDVVIKGSNVMGGYQNNPAANANSFTAGWFQTGDQGRLDSDGYLFLTGRTKEIINRGGEKISPREVDDALMEHPAVKQALAFALPDARLGEDVAAAVVLKEGCTATALELCEFVAARLANFKVPRQIVLLDEIPKGPTGKPVRIGLAKILGLTDSAPAKVAPRQPQTPPRTRTEEQLAGLWQQVLGVNSVGVHDDFFEMGGDSILAAQFCSRVAAVLGVQLSFPGLFEARTLEGIAGLLELEMAGQGRPKPPSIERAARGSAIPLSYSQRQYWFLERFENGGANFVRPNACVLRGPLDVELLRESLNQVVARHEILRTTYHESDGVPVQRVQDARPVALPLTDLTGIPEGERSGRVHELARSEAWRPFNLSADQVLRASLLKLADEEHILLLTTHHIAADGWSDRVVLREVAELYGAKCEGRAAVLPELPVQYADFAQFQHRCFADGRFDAQIEYWKTRLAGCPELLRLPTDRPRPERQTYRGGVESAVVPKQTVAALKDLGLRHHATLYMTLLAAFQVLLSRHSGDQDLVVGSPIAGRTNPQTEPLVGLFASVLAMRADLSGDPSFQEFIAQTRRSVLDAHVNQDVPIEKLIEQLSLNRTARHPALFQVLFQLRNLGAETAHLGPVTLEPFDFDPGTGEFDLYLDVWERAQGLYCVLNYNSDLYDGATARRILGQYETLLQAIVTDAGQRVSQLNILPDEERRQVLVEWNETAAEYPCDSSMHELVEARARATPDAIAAICRNEQLTYEELNRRANGLAHLLWERGAGRGALVGIALERSIALAVALVGVLKAGAAYVPLDPEYPRQRLADMLDDTHCTLVITTSGRARNLAGAGVEVLGIDPSDPEGAISSDQPPAAGVRGHDCAYVIFTSGSTGRPNGVPVEHRSLANISRFFAKHVGLEPGDRVLQFNSFSFDAAAEEIFSCWLAGATLVFWPEPKAPSLAEFVEFVEREQITLLDLPTAYWHEWASEIAAGGLPMPSSVRAVVIGGEKALAPKLALWEQAAGGRIRLCNTYGPTEATITSTVYDAVPGKGAAGRIPIGRPIANTTLYILDRLLQPVPIGVPGELYIGGAGVSRGYLNRPELTAQRFIANPFRDAPDPRLYKTGDRVRYLPDGNVEFLGRTDDQVKWRGFRIELGELENALAHHPQVRAAAASLREDPEEQPGLVAYIVPDGAPPTPNQLARFLKTRLPNYSLPSRYVFLETLPLMPNGKVDREALRIPEQTNPRMATEVCAPRTSTEDLLLQIWEDVLDRRPIGMEEDFFELGGHSLLGVRLLARVEAVFGKRLTLASFFEAPTVAQMAGQLRNGAQVATGQVIPLRSGTGGMPLYILHGTPIFRSLILNVPKGLPVRLLSAFDPADMPRPCRLEDIAARQAEAILRDRPDGPLAIAGWCADGVLAVEMAQQFLQRGKSVPLVVLIDSFNPARLRRGGRLKTRSSLMAGRLRFHLANLSALNAARAGDYVAQRWRTVEKGAKRQIRGWMYGQDQTAQQLRDFCVMRYEPRPYAGPVILFRAQARASGALSDPAEAWRPLLPGLEVVDVPGDHEEIFSEPNVHIITEYLASRLTRATTGAPEKTYAHMV